MGLWIINEFLNDIQTLNRNTLTDWYIISFTEGAKDTVSKHYWEAHMDYSQVKAAADWLDTTGTSSTIKKLQTAV